MLDRRYFVVHCLFMTAVISIMAADQVRAAEADDEAAAQQKQQELIAVLESDAPPQDKAITCKHLAVYGDKQAVPALAALLPDEALASWARIALEVIPDSAADDALREAAGKLQGRVLAGVINSIGVRKDAKAVDVLVERLKDSDAAVASAAAVALGCISNATAAKALEQSLATAPDAVSSAVAEGCILCAERALKDGKQADAVRIYDMVRQADVPKQRIIEATRGAILARQADGVPLLVEQLQSADKSFFAIGLTVARELEGPAVTDALVSELGRAAPDRQALLILTLADRGDTAALPALLQTAKSGPTAARIAAFRVLKQLGDASCVPVLLDAALEPEEVLSSAALDVLADLPGDDVDGDVAARLGEAEGKTRQVLIQLAGRRQIAATVPALIKAVDDPDAQTRSAALTALGFAIQFRDLPVLIARVVDPPADANESKAAQTALRVASERMPDREACAAKLATAISSAPMPAKCSLLEILAVMGGSTALEAVGAAAKDTAPELQDTASRLLGEWMTVDAAPVLLDLAKNSPDAKYEIRALRGYIRLARQFTMPEEQRAEMCRMALNTAERDDEKKLVLQVLERYPSIDMLRLAVEAAKIPSLKNAAAATSLVIAQKIGGSADAQ
ncbi:MAG: HEAT repeat domain-containing protein, partial [Planctomycetes bacterium]|nr:HEAT repeat domain-containing protein [Planctomycetota bacterium]